MNIEAFRLYCLSKKGAEECLPFDDDTLVFKVAGKMFALIAFSNPYRCNLKCEPEYAITLRNNFRAVLPGYHMNKKHWNTVVFNDDLSDAMIYQLIDHSYEKVVQKLPKKLRENIR